MLIVIQKFADLCYCLAIPAGVVNNGARNISYMF